MPEVTEHKHWSEKNMKEETAKTSIGPMLPFLCVMHGETQGPAVPGANMPAYTEELRTFPHQGAPARGKITQPCRCVRPRQQQELLRSGPMAQNKKRLVKKRNEVYTTIALGIHGRHFKTMSVCTRKSMFFRRTHTKPGTTIRYGRNSPASAHDTER